MPDPVDGIPNIGPATAAAFARAGLTEAAAVRALGPDAAHARLLAAGERPHFIAYCAIVMGLMGRPWNDGRRAEKAALRARFDGIMAAARDGAAGNAGLDRALAEIGVVPRR